MSGRETRWGASGCCMPSTSLTHSLSQLTSTCSRPVTRCHVGSGSASKKTGSDDDIMHTKTNPPTELIGTHRGVVWTASICVPFATTRPRLISVGGGDPIFIF